MDDGTINGTVVDESGDPLAGVDIATVPATVTATSDASGAFSLAGVPVGVYSVAAALAGYEDFTLTGVGVAAGATTAVSLAMTPVAAVAGAIAGTVSTAAGAAFAGATVTVEGGTASAVTAADGTFTLADVPPGSVFLHAAPPDPATFLPGETRRAVRVQAGVTTSGVAIRLSGRPSDSATYVGSTLCSGCHASQTTAQRASAHYRSIALDQSRMIAAAATLFPAFGGTATTGVSAANPTGAAGNVVVYACQNTAGVYSFKFGGTADCTVTTDGTLVPVAGTYGGEGDGGVDGGPNLGVWKQRYLALLDDVPVAAGWSYTAGRSLDRLILPVQITEVGDGAPKFAAYKNTDWNTRGRTFSRKCAGCHETGLDIAWEASTTFITSYAYNDLNIGCETCHGPGSDHIAAPAATRANNIVSLRNLTAAGQRQACGMCHAADDGSSADPSGSFGYAYNAANAALVGGGQFVPGVYNPADYIRGYGVTTAAGGAFNAWPDGIHGKAHRQQVAMLEASVHANNSERRMACPDCHDAHTLYQGPAALEASDGVDTYEFMTPTFGSNVLCLSCHASGADFAGIGQEDVAVAFLNAGGDVSRGGIALTTGDFTAAQVAAAVMAVARGVGDHMQETTWMGLAAYDPLNDAMPVGRCTSCHMPRVAKSGGYTTGLDALGRTALVSGDQGSHVFDIVWPAQSAALRRATGGADTDIMPNSCGGCHAGSRLSGD